MASFGDRVRVRESAETVAAGINGLEGDIYGFTSPSVTGVAVIGGSPEDQALNVYFEERRESSWLRPDLVEKLHHNPGIKMKVGNHRAVRRADGSWEESIASTGQPTQ